MQMIKKVSEYINKYHMLTSGDVVIAGISGGADSVCLLLLLQSLKDEFSLSLHVVHVNHMIRQEAAEDEDFVVSLCKRFDIPCHVVHEDVEALAASRHITTEEAGREVRYAAFAEYLKKYAPDGNGKIAIAHNKNDSAETFLFHLFRGSGLQGLTGIAPVRDNIIRPLLCVERKEIEKYLAEQGEAFCTDKTNLTDDYARNRIRHHILEYADREICTAAVAHTQEAAERITEACELMHHMTETAYREAVKVLGRNNLYIDKNRLDAYDKILHGYVIMAALAKLTGTRKDIASVHIQSILALFDKQTGRRVNLPYGCMAQREYDGITLRRMEDESEKTVQEEIILEPVEGVFRTVRLKSGELLEYGIFPRVAEEIIPQKSYTKWLDYDKIKGRMTIRSRAAGDYLTVNDRYQKQSLKSFLINQKIPREKRDAISLLTDGNHIIWVIGSRISSYYKVGEDTRRILKVILRGGVEDG